MNTHHERLELLRVEFLVKPVQEEKPVLMQQRSEHRASASVGDSDPDRTSALPDCVGPGELVPRPRGEELTLAEAARTFNVSEATLRRLISAAVLPARSVKGVRGSEWRIAVAALDEADFKRRPVDTRELPELAEIRRLAGALAAERARSSRLDSELGYALLTIGHLRGRLREAGIEVDESFGSNLNGGRA